MRVYMGELMRVAKATASEGEVGETENPKENEVDKPKNSAGEREGELSTETSSKTLDKSDAEYAYDRQTVRQALRSSEESVALFQQTSDETSGACL